MYSDQTFVYFSFYSEKSLSASYLHANGSVYLLLATIKMYISFGLLSLYIFVSVFVFSRIQLYPKVMGPKIDHIFFHKHCERSLRCGRDHQLAIDQF